MLNTKKLTFVRGAVKCLSASAILFAANLASAADGWTPAAYTVSVIDIVAADNSAYITLDGYVNSACSLNRVMLTHSSPAKFDQMFSMVLSAFHSGSKVTFYFPDTANCSSTRIQLSQ